MARYYVLFGIIGIVIGWVLGEILGAVFGLFLGLVFVGFFCLFPYLAGVVFSIANGFVGYQTGIIIGFYTGYMDAAPFIGMAIGGIVGVIFSLLFVNIVNDYGDNSGWVIICTVIFGALGAVVGEGFDVIPEAIYGAIIGVYLGFIVGGIIRFITTDRSGELGFSIFSSPESSLTGDKSCYSSGGGKCVRCGRCD